jgi:hypothetical protein
MLLTYFQTNDNHIEVIRDFHQDNDKRDEEKKGQVYNSLGLFFCMSFFPHAISLL